MSGNEASCVDNVPSEEYLASEHQPRKSTNMVSRTRQSYTWDMNPELDPDATVYVIYLRYMACGMCSYREFRDLGVDIYYLRFLFHVANFRFWFLCARSFAAISAS